MIIRRRTGASQVGFISLTVLYLVLIGLVLVFAGQVLRDLSFTSSTAMVVIVLAVIFPLLLLIIVLVNVIHLLRERSLGRPGARLKVRLLFFFLVIVLLASVPQGILSVSFIRTAIRSWFSEDTGMALQGGQNLALAFFNEQQGDLRRFVEGPYVDALLEDVETQPARVWERIRGVNPSIDGMQVFTPQFQESFMGGPATHRLSPRSAATTREGQVARETREDVSFLRIRYNRSDSTRTPVATQSGPPPEYTVIFSVALPPGFDQAAGRLTAALEFFVQLDRFQTRFVAALAVFYGFFFLPLILLSLLVSFYLSDEIMRPIVSLEEATRRVAEGDFSTRILARRGDELSTLVGSFNRMVGELERTRQKIIQTEKIAAWQEIAQRLAHEVKNPLTPIRLAAERSLRKYENQSRDFEDVFRTSVRSIVTEVDNLSALLSEFREFSRLPAPTMEPVELGPLVGEILETYVSRAHFQVDSDVPAGLVLWADAAQLRQVVANLVRNATDAMEPGGTISIHADRVSRGSTAYCRLQVADTGPGIPDEDKDRIFDPYVTTKPKGTGLGLSIVQRIVFDHQGQIWFESQPGVGTTFYLDLPLDAPHSSRGGTPE